MSGVLDQLLLEDIAKYCPEHFLEYHKCMSNPSSECIEIQKKLSSCIKSEVPSFKRIQDDCNKKLRDYELCLRTEVGKGNSNSKAINTCYDQLVDLRKCATGAIDKKN